MARRSPVVRCPGSGHPPVDADKDVARASLTNRPTRPRPVAPGQGRIGGAADGGGDHGEIESGSAFLPQRVAVDPAPDLFEQRTHRPQDVAVRAVRARGAPVEGHLQLLAALQAAEHALADRDEHDVHAFECRCDGFPGGRRGPEVEQILVGEDAPRLPAHDALDLPVGESHLQRQAKSLHDLLGRGGERDVAAEQDVARRYEPEQCYAPGTRPRRCDASPPTSARRRGADQTRGRTRPRAAHGAAVVLPTGRRP
jgi:hypothetical protein